jgi:hypothetical protein
MPGTAAKVRVSEKPLAVLQELIRLPERKCPFLVGPSMSAKTSAGTSDPTTRESVSETKAAEKRRTPQSARAQDFFGLRRFFRRFGFSQGGPYRPGLGPAQPTRSGWQGTSWDPYQSVAHRGDGDRTACVDFGEGFQGLLNQRIAVEVGLNRQQVGVGRKRWRDAWESLCVWECTEPHRLREAILEVFQTQLVAQPDRDLLGHPPSKMPARRQLHVGV